MFKYVFLIFLCGKLVFGFKSNLAINIIKMDIKNVDNPFIGDMSAVINPEPKENSVDLTFTIKDVITKGKLVIVTIDTGNGKKNDFKIPLCDAVNEIMIGSDIFSKLLPRNKAPKQCPFNPAVLRLEKYKPNKTMFPPGVLKDGNVKFDLKITDEKENPFVDIHVELEISGSSMKMG